METVRRLIPLVLAVAAGPGCSPHEARPASSTPSPRVGPVSAPPSPRPPTAKRARPTRPRAAAPALRPLTGPVGLADLMARFAAHRRRQRGLTAATLQRRHRTAYLARPTFDVRQAEFLAGFRKAFGLSPAALRVLRKRGFVVVPGPGRKGGGRRTNDGEGPSNLFYRVFAAKLPVFVSADSILHAWHRTFTALLADRERRVARPQLRRMLEKTLETLDRRVPDQRDAYVYLAVARMLVQPGWTPHWKVRSEVVGLWRAVLRRRPAWIRLLGARVLVDFGRFRPRGHYADHGPLAAYFRSMTWLGEVGLVLRPSPSRRSRGESFARQEAAARAVVGALERSGAQKHYRALDGLYVAVAGAPLTTGPRALAARCRAAGLVACGATSQQVRTLYARAPTPSYSARFFMAQRRAVVFHVLPKRFGYSAFVTSRTTTPRLGPAIPGGRSQATAFDIAFALGNQRALRYLGRELRHPRRRALPAVLEAARRTLRDVPPARLGGAVTHHWLQALQHLSARQTAPHLPQVIRTAAWQDRKLEAVLGSLTELRRDTALIVRPSVGGKGCQYPQGYVEPVPALYASLARAAARLATLFSGRGRRDARVRRFLAHWRGTMKQLARLAHLERAALPMPKADLAFLNKTVDAHRYGYDGVRRYDGWYPKLFWNPSWGLPWANGEEGLPMIGPVGTGGSLPKLAVADLHYDTDGHRVLQTAVGYPSLMIVAIDAGKGVALYGGPVYSTYLFNRPLANPLTEQTWKSVVGQGSAPRPVFTRSYRAR